MAEEECMGQGRFSFLFFFFLRCIYMLQMRLTWKGGKLLIQTKEKTTAPVNFLEHDEISN